MVVGDVVHPPVEAVTVDVDVVSLDHSRPGIAGLVFLRVLVDVAIGVVANFILGMVLLADTFGARLLNPLANYFVWGSTANGKNLIFFLISV